MPVASAFGAGQLIPASIVVLIVPGTLITIGAVLPVPKSASLSFAVSVPCNGELNTFPVGNVDLSN